MSGSGVACLGMGYCASWDVRDYDYVSKIYAKIRQTKVDTLFDKLERVYLDQTVDEPDFEPYAVGISFNKLTNDGLTRVAELVTGTVGLNTGFQQSTGLFSYFACGSGTNPVSASDYQLQAEIARVGLADSGYMTAAGAIMRFGGYFPPTISGPVTVNEGGVFDDPNSGIMLFRTVFPAGQGISHSPNVDFFGIAHSAFMYSV